MLWSGQIPLCAVFRGDRRGRLDWLIVSAAEDACSLKVRCIRQTHLRCCCCALRPATPATGEAQIDHEWR